jgi:hypothetical protein
MAEEKTSELSELARRLAAQRRIVSGNCEVCGTPFTGTRKKRYCSHNCAQKAYMVNKAAKNTAKGANDVR